MTKETKQRILWIIRLSLIINIVLVVLKLSMGYIGGSTSLISDGYNSLSDVVLSVIILLTMRISVKAPDDDHPYGHHKFEGVLYFGLGIMIGLISLLIGYQGVSSLIDYINDPSSASQPSLVAVSGAAIALILKLIVVYLNYRGYKKYQSPVLKGDYYNHLYDAMATSIVLISVVLAQFDWILFDDIASIVISFIMLHSAFLIVKEALSYLVDQAPDENVRDAIYDAVLVVEGVISVDDLKVRKHVNYLYVDVEIAVLHTLNLKEAHEISERVHNDIEEKFEKVLHVMVHVNPYEEGKRMEYFKLNNGIHIPKIGIGTNTFGKVDNAWDGEINFDTTPLITAFNAGYRLVDTAIRYRNEAVIGKALKESDIKRSEFFITSKIPAQDDQAFSEAKTIEQIEGSIEAIGEYIDLYLIHHPWDDLEHMLKVWRVMEDFHDKGLLKALGVSNFNEEQLSYLIKHARIKPAVNQVESNPGNWNHEIIKFCLLNDVLPQAWSPIKNITNQDILEKIGAKYYKTWVQVLLRYQIQRGVCVIPKSHNAERQKQNLDIFGFTLSEKDMADIEK